MDPTQAVSWDVLAHTTGADCTVRGVFAWMSVPLRPRRHLDAWQSDDRGITIQVRRAGLVVPPGKFQMDPLTDRGRSQVYNPRRAQVDVTYQAISARPTPVTRLV
jgi:hypothetical protein